MEYKLKDQVAIVTGGSAGIGKAIAHSLALEGCLVCTLSTNVQKGQEACASINRLLGEERAHFYQVDTSDFAAVQAAIQEITTRFGRVDILVNNAGITSDKLLMKMQEADWDRVLDVNAKSCFNTCQAVVRPMLRAKRGKILNISSIVGLTGNTGQVNYAASKAAIIGLTKSLAKELASRHITVNCIAPGYIGTDMTAQLPQPVKETLLGQIPLGRMGTPEDIAHAALFLVSSLADYITGQVLVVDGGMVM